MDLQLLVAEFYRMSFPLLYPSLYPLLYPSLYLYTFLYTFLYTCLCSLTTSLVTDRQFYEYGSFNSHAYTSEEILDLGHSCIAAKKCYKSTAFWRKSKSFVILFDFLVVRVRGLGRENSGALARTKGHKERGEAPSKCSASQWLGISPIHGMPLCLIVFVISLLLIVGGVEYFPMTSEITTDTADDTNFSEFLYVFVDTPWILS